jgi:hypothetical protein
MILNKEMFRDEVIDHVSRHKTSYMDAILHLLDKHGLEPEDAPKLINQAMKAQLEAEGVSLNMVEGKHTDESKLLSE